MKILHIIDKLVGGGAETQLRLLVNNSHLSTHTIIYVRPGGENLINENVILVCLEEKPKRIIIKNLIQILKNTEFEILQTWLPDYLCIPAITYSRFFKKKVKIISGDRRAPLKKISYLYFRDRLKLIQHGFADIIVSNFSFKKFGSISGLILYLKNKKVLFNAVHISNNSRHVVKFNDEVNLIFVGRLIEHKRPELLLGLLKYLDENSKLAYKVRYFGEGNMLSILSEKTVASNYTEQVYFNGFVKSWVDDIRSDSILIFPSLNEGMPNVLFEAAANRVPFICSDLEEIRCHFADQKECLMVDPQNADLISTYARYVLQIIDNKDKTQLMVAAARKKAEEYSTEKYIKNWHQIYSKLMLEKK